MALYKFQFAHLFWECGSRYKFAMACRDRTKPYRKEMIEAVQWERKERGIRSAINTWKRFIAPPLPSENAVRSKKPDNMKRYHDNPYYTNP